MSSSSTSDDVRRARPARAARAARPAGTRRRSGRCGPGSPRSRGRTAGSRRRSCSSRRCTSPTSRRCSGRRTRRRRRAGRDQPELGVGVGLLLLRGDDRRRRSGRTGVLLALDDGPARRAAGSPVSRGVASSVHVVRCSSAHASARLSRWRKSTIAAALRRVGEGVVGGDQVAEAGGGADAVADHLRARRRAAATAAGRASRSASTSPAWNAVSASGGGRLTGLMSS